MNKNALKNKRGFTLVELMVVVAIMAVLTAVALPVFASVTQRTERSTCHYNMKAMVRALHMDTAIDIATATSHQITQHCAQHPQQYSQYVCPNKSGNIQVDKKQNAVVIRCNIHGETQQEQNPNPTPSTSPEVSPSPAPITTPAPPVATPSPSPTPSEDEIPELPIKDWQEYWPDYTTYEPYEHRTVQAGGAFQWGNDVWVICKPANGISQSMAQQGPSSIENWFASVKLNTGRVYTKDTLPPTHQTGKYSRGDLAYVNGSYYVFKDGGSVSNGFPGNQWYKIPS